MARQVGVAVTVRGRCRRTGAALAVSLLALAGLSCGRSGPAHPLFPVHGQVLLDGRPLAGVLVMLHPAASSAGEEANPYAQTDADGRFSIGTSEGGGAPAGTYRVAVRDTRGGEEETRSDVKGTFRRTRTVSPPARYGDPATSGLSAKVAEGPNELEPFRLTTRPGDSTRPQPLPVDD